MSDRPTPEQIMEHNWPYSWTKQLERLAEHGYVIVHPDDIPIDCRDFIFTTAEQEPTS